MSKLDKDKSILKEYIREIDIEDTKRDLEANGIDTDAVIKDAINLVNSFNKKNVYKINSNKNKNTCIDNCDEKLRVNDQ